MKARQFIAMEQSQKTQKLTLKLCGPRGFCAGVDRAIQIVVLALKKHGAPVYVRHEIVHNKYVVDGLRKQGAVFIKELSDIPSEHIDRPVVFSAHGVPKSVPADAEARNLYYLDATCPLVSKVHKQAMRHQRLGRHVVLIGHVGHPEVIGTMGQLQADEVSLVEDVAQANLFVAPNDMPLGFVTQTTLSIDETADTIAALQKRFPDIAAPSSESICYATTNRQLAVRQAAPDTDYFMVVGATNSSNSKRLVEVAKNSGSKKSELVAGLENVDFSGSENWQNVGLSAGASAPEILINEIIAAFDARFDLTVELATFVEEDEVFPVMRALRDTELTTEDMAFVNGHVPQAEA